MDLITEAPKSTNEPNSSPTARRHRAIASWLAFALTSICSGNAARPKHAFRHNRRIEHPPDNRRRAFCRCRQIRLHARPGLGPLDQPGGERVAFDIAESDGSQLRKKGGWLPGL
jgi:hypothetical protein